MGSRRDDRIQDALSPFAWSARRKVVVGVLALFGLQLAFLGLWQARTDSPTWDETIYLTAGHTGLTQRDARINADHPPLPKVLAAIPAVLFGDVVVPIDSESWETADTHGLSLETYAANRDRIQATIFLFRIVPMLEGLLIGLLLYLLARDFAGWRAGLLAAGLWSTLPTTLAFCHIDCLDVPAALVTVFVAWLVNRYADQRSLLRLALVGLGVGVALQTRAGMGFVIAAGAALAVAVVGIRQCWWRALLSGAGTLLIGWVVVWIGYAIVDPNGLQIEALPIEQRDLLATETRGAFSWLALAVPWPARFAASLQYLAAFHAEIGPGYLFGVTFDRIPWWFWPGSLWLKTPPTALAVIAVGLVAWLRLPAHRRLRGLVVLGIPLVGLMVMMSQAQRSFGVRYLMPLIALLPVVAAPAVVFVRQRWTVIVALVLGVFHIGMFWEAHPHSLTWSTPGMRPAWRYAADCNSDWGQGFAAIQEWAKDKEEPYIAYFGFGPSWNLEEIHGAISAFPEGPMGPYQPPKESVEWFAISASNLTIFQPGYFTLLRRSCPVSVLDESILIYHLTDHAGRLDDGLPGGIPVLPCPDEEYSIKLR